MKLTITKKRINNRKFINYLPKYIKDIFIKKVDKKQIELISNSLQLDCYDIIETAINTLIISESGDEFVISTNKNLFYKNKNLELLINQITFGSLSVKGYDILYDIFNNIAENIEFIYKQWMDGVI